MIDVRNKFDGGLDLDSSYYDVARNSYVDALNITKDAIAGNADRAITNVVGNRIVSYTFPADGVVIGAYAYPLRNTVIFFRYSPDGYDGVYEFDNTTRTITKIFECLTDSATNILNFTLSGKITGVNIFPRTTDEGDLLFFLDSLGRPTTLNITRFKNGEYSPVTRDIIDLGKRPPLSPPTNVYGNDNTRTSNFTHKKLFRFKYAWGYDDNEKSTYSPIGALPLPVNILNPAYTNVQSNNNVITVSLNSGPQNVKTIELVVSIANNTNIFSRFGTVIQINKADQGIADDTDFSYSFYNDGTYPFISDDESLLLFDYVPTTAKAQEMPNGNVVALAAIEEGLSRELDPNVVITILTVPAGGGTPIGGLNGVVTIILDNSLTQIFQIAFSGTPAVGTIVTVKIQTVSGGLVQTGATYTTIAGDTASSVAAGIVASFISLGIVFSASTIGGATVGVQTNAILSPKKIFFAPLIITPPGSTVDDNSIATWPFFGQRQLGIQYYDQKGKTNGVLYNAGIVFPNYNESGGSVLLPYINIKIYHVPPIWAYSYQIVFTKDPTEFLYIETSNVDGTVGVMTDTDYVYFNITNLGINQEKNPTTAAVVSWTFQDGDRVRVIKRNTPAFIYGPSYDTGIEGIVVDPSIGGVTQTGQTFVKVRRLGLFLAEDWTIDDFYVIQLYRPGQQIANEANQPYFECGVQYPILNPTTAEREHGGQVTDQDIPNAIPAEINIYEGDCYFRVRQEYLSDTGIATFFVQDLNFVDFYISAVNSVDGRPTAIDINAKESFYGAFLRFSRDYEPDTNINGLNRFFPNNTQKYDDSYGIVERLKVRDRNMRVFQTNKTGNVALFSELGKAANGDAVQLVTDRLLNPIQYYVGDWGIGTAATSLASFDYADYYCDNIRGVVVRVSQDGQKPISLLYRVNSWATVNLPLRTGNSFIYGTYNQKLNDYVIALEQATIANAMTVSFQVVLNVIGTPHYIVSLSNTPNLGDIVNVHLIDGDGIVRDYSYTVVDGDTLTTIVTALNSLINADVYFNSFIQTSFPVVGLNVVQVTASNPDDFDGVTTIQYAAISYSPAQTLSFSEEENSFESYLSYFPEMMCNLGTLLITFKNGNLYTHDNTVYNRFYDVDYESYWKPVFNENPLQKKTFLSITEAADVIWDCPEIISQVNSYGVVPQTTNLVEAEIKPLEGQYHSSIKRDSNSRGGKVNGAIMKGNWLTVKFRVQNASTLRTLNIVSLKYINSPLTNT